MKVSLNWIKDYVDLPRDLDVSKLTYDLTMSTVEVEGAEILRDKFDKIVVGLVEEVLPHPNADKLRVCRTDIGGGEIREIVCGGVNLSPGMKVAVAQPGAMVRWHGEGDLVEIKNAKLRGVESYGMICASSEIGLFDLFPFTEPATIVDLSAFDAAPGTNLAVALGVDDVILEIDNKSLTNRPDLWGHYGIARELSALYDAPLKALPDVSLPAESGGLRIDIADPDRCPRYAGIKIENVSTKPASFEIQSRIWRVGMRPINAVVDITNYVMLAVGQPTHGFDTGNIEGGITVRRARDGETLTLLNDRELTLNEEDLVIADDTEAVALAGVMGGGKDSILGDTTDVILEIANFSALGTRKTAQRYELRTEASIRYEKGIDPQRVDQGIRLACALFAAEFPMMRLAGYVDNYPKPLAPTAVDVSLDWLAKRMGKRLPNETIEAMLRRLGFDVAIDGDKLHVVSPTWRSTGDISLPDDIMEEIARLYGYENFESTPIATTFAHAINQRGEEAERRVREYLSYRCGMQEVFTYPWVEETYLDAFFPDRADMLALATPPAPDERHIRSSLLPNLLRAVADNVRTFDSFAVYELSQVFFDRDYTSPYDERERLPFRRKNLAGAFVSSIADVSSLFRRAKGVLAEMGRYAQTEALSFDQSGPKPYWADDVVWLTVLCGGQHIGSLALLSKKSALACGIKQASAMLFEIDVEKLEPLASRSNRFVHLPAYPQVEYDISMLFDESAKWEEIAATAAGKPGPDNLVRSVRFVDEYRGKQIEKGKKSVTLRLLLGSETKTLTSEEVDAAANTIAKRLAKKLGGEIRGAA